MHMRAADPRIHLPRARTYPGVLPVLHLDHIYYDAAHLELTRLELIRTRLALVASDHLPLVADFRIKYDLADMLSRMPPDYQASEESFGVPVGKEE